MLIEDRYRKLMVVYHRVLSENKRIKEALSTATSKVAELTAKVEKLTVATAPEKETTTEAEDTTTKASATVVKRSRKVKKAKATKTETTEATIDADINLTT